MNPPPDENQPNENKPNGGTPNGEAHSREQIRKLIEGYLKGENRFRPGEVRLGAPEGEVMTPELIREDEVATARLHALFKAAFMKAELDDDGDLRVGTEGGPRVWVLINDGRKMLRFMALYAFVEGTPDDQKLELVNAMNDNLIMVRFAVSGESLTADYYLSYEEGILPYQIVHSLRAMARVVTNALAEYDTRNIVS